MKNKGFTLIELLAVIVILAIIALIATPIILGIINDARTEAKERSAELAYTGVQYAVTTYMYKNNGNVPTTVEQIEPYFEAENVTMTDGVIKDDSNTELCEVTANSGVFTVTCEGLMDTKTIFATE